VAPHLRVEMLGDLFEFGIELLLTQLAGQAKAARLATRRAASRKPPRR
jgi:hypothetical protein